MLISFLRGRPDDAARLFCAYLTRKEVLKIVSHLNDRPRDGEISFSMGWIDYRGKEQSHSVTILQNDKALRSRIEFEQDIYERGL